MSAEFNLRVIPRFRPVNSREKEEWKRGRVLHFLEEAGVDQFHTKFMRKAYRDSSKWLKLFGRDVEKAPKILKRDFGMNAGMIRKFQRWLDDFNPARANDTTASEEFVPIKVKNDSTEVDLWHAEEERQYRFTFDKVLWWEQNQQTCFKSCAEPLVLDVLKGINATIFAYGQSGSGKTYTMFGPEPLNKAPFEQLGLIPLSMAYLFKAQDMEEYENIDVRMSFLELYLSDIRDLIEPKDLQTKKPKQLHIREMSAALLREKQRPKAAGGGKKKRRGNKSGRKDLRGSKGKKGPSDVVVFIEGLSRHKVNSVKEVQKMISMANQERTMSSTNLNESSSRSHMVVTAYVTVKSLNGDSCSSTFTFGDLAGSEKVKKTDAKGDQLKEAQAINKSLTTLRAVMNGLAKHKSHVPYRDSKLTLVLKNSLSGNTKTTLVINCSPHVWNKTETLNTLQFGQRAKHIKNTVQANVDISVPALQKKIKELEGENKKLKDQISFYKLKAEEEAAEEANGPLKCRGRTMSLRGTEFDAIQASLPGIKPGVEPMKPGANEGLQVKPIMFQTPSMNARATMLSIDRSTHQMLQRELDDKTELLNQRNGEIDRLKRELGQAHDKVGIYNRGDEVLARTKKGWSRAVILRYNTSTNTYDVKFMDKGTTGRGWKRFNIRSLAEQRDLHEVNFQHDIQRLTEELQDSREANNELQEIAKKAVEEAEVARKAASAAGAGNSPEIIGKLRTEISRLKEDLSKAHSRGGSSHSLTLGRPRGYSDADSLSTTLNRRVDQEAKFLDNLAGEIFDVQNVRKQQHALMNSGAMPNEQHKRAETQMTMAMTDAGGYDADPYAIAGGELRILEQFPKSSDDEMMEYFAFREHYKKLGPATAARVFMEADRDNMGKVSVKQIKDFCQIVHMREERLTDIAAFRGQLTSISEQFNEVLRTLPQMSFEDLDKNDDGLLSLQELRSNFDQVHGIVIDRIYAFLDKNKDGRISAPEFKFFVDHLAGRSDASARMPDMSGVFITYVGDVRGVFKKYGEKKGRDVVLSMQGAKYIIGELRDDKNVSDNDQAIFLLTGIRQKELENLIKNCPMEWWQTLVESTQDSIFGGRLDDRPSTLSARRKMSTYSQASTMSRYSTAASQQPTNPHSRSASKLQQLAAEEQDLRRKEAKLASITDRERILADKMRGALGDADEQPMQDSRLSTIKEGGARGDPPPDMALVKQHSVPTSMDARSFGTPRLPDEMPEEKSQAKAMPAGPWKCDVCRAANKGGNQCTTCMSMRAGAEPPSKVDRSISNISIPEPQKAKKGKKTKNEMDLKKKFDELDEDGNGSLNFREWCFALNDLGIPWQPDKAKRIWKEMDLDNSKGIDFQEFTAAMQEMDPDLDLFFNKLARGEKVDLLAVAQSPRGVKTFSDAEIKKLLRSRDSDWKDRDNAMRQLAMQLSDKRVSDSEMARRLTGFIPGLNTQILERRSCVVREVCVAVMKIAVERGKAIRKFVPKLTDALFETARSSIKTLSKAAFSCLDVIYRNVPDDSINTLLDDLIRIYKANRKYGGTKKNVFEMIQRIIQADDGEGNPLNDPNYSDIMPLIMLGLKDSGADGRNAALCTLACVEFFEPAHAKPVISGFNGVQERKYMAKKNMLKDRRKKKKAAAARRR